LRRGKQFYMALSLARPPADAASLRTSMLARRSWENGREFRAYHIPGLFSIPWVQLSPLLPLTAADEELTWGVLPWRGLVEIRTRPGRWKGRFAPPGRSRLDLDLLTRSQAGLGGQKNSASNQSVIRVAFQAALGNRVGAGGSSGLADPFRARGSFGPLAWSRFGLTWDRNQVMACYVYHLLRLIRSVWSHYNPGILFDPGGRP